MNDTKDLAALEKEFAAAKPEIGSERVWLTLGPLWGVSCVADAYRSMGKGDVLRTVANVVIVVFCAMLYNQSRKTRLLHELAARVIDGYRTRAG